MWELIKERFFLIEVNVPIFFNGGSSMNNVLGPKTPQQQKFVLRPTEKVSFFLFYFFYCELHMVDMCVCVICSQWMTFTIATFMCIFCCCCHLWAKLHVQIGRILHKSSKVYHKKRERERDSRTTTHAGIAKVMGNYKGTGWQLWLQSSESDEASYLSCQLACTCERMCDTQTIYSLYRSLSYTKRVEMPLWFPIYGNTLRLPFKPRTSNALHFYWNRKKFSTTCLLFIR